MKKTYYQLNEEFDKKVKELQKECNHPVSKLGIDKDHSIIGRGALYPRIDIICGICNIKWVIFQDVLILTNKKRIIKIWEEMTKIGANRCNIDKGKTTHFTFLDSGIFPELTKEESDKWRLPYKRLNNILILHKGGDLNGNV